MYEIALYLNCDSQFDVRSRGALKEVVRLVFWKIVKRLKLGYLFRDRGPYLIETSPLVCRTS